MTDPSLDTNALNVISEQTNHLSLQAINVCGLKQKSKIPEFMNTLKLYDISLLCETKLDDADKELIEESVSDLKLKAFFKNRKTMTSYRSGGLCIIFSEHIEKILSPYRN